MPDPKVIHVLAFEPFRDQEPPDTTIIIRGDPPKFDGTGGMKQHENFYEQQAWEIVEALANSLPQGTFDRLGMYFMMRKVSLYRGKTE